MTIATPHRLAEKERTRRGAFPTSLLGAPRRPIATDAPVIADHLLEILRCPQSRTRLHAADSELIARLNRAISAGTLTNLAGERVARSLDGGLVREAGDLVYPIVDQIPVLLPDQAIDITNL
jgi:uncharacterized protein YbaR (Trm112 family)